MPVPRVIEVRGGGGSTASEEIVEEEYDRYARKKVMKQLQLLLLYARQYKLISFLPQYKIIFLMLENRTLQTLFALSQNRYLTTKRVYRDFSVDRLFFIESQLNDVSQHC